MDTHLRIQSAAAERNWVPILAELERLLAPQGSMLEIASGTGQHAAHFAESLAGWTWQPSETDAQAHASINAWCARLPNVLPALVLDVLADPWLGAPSKVDAMFCANMLHIAPSACCAGLMQGAARHLAPQGLLLTYGPYLEDDVPTSAGNLSFDTDLRQRNPAWGIRRVADVAEQASAVGLRLRERVALPANNLLLVWARVDQAGEAGPEVRALT